MMGNEVEDFMNQEDYKGFLKSRPKEEVLEEIANHFIKVMEIDPQGVFASDFRSFMAEGEVEDFIEDYVRSKAAVGNLREEPGFADYLKEVRV